MAKSRCDLCDKKIGPSRYELGLCAGCELLAQHLEATMVVMGLARLVTDPSFPATITKISNTYADIVKAAQDK